MKKIFSIIIGLIVIFSFNACSNDSSVNNQENSEIITTDFVTDSDITDVLCQGSWYINTNGDGMARGEGRYVDFITFHTDETYEKAQLVSSFRDGNTYLQSQTYKVVDEYIIVYNFEEGIDYVFELSENNNELILLNGIVRLYESNQPQFYYVEEYEQGSKGYNSLDECLSNLKRQEDFSTYVLYNEIDKSKTMILSGVWSPTNWQSSWQSSMSPENINIAFSRDGYCYVWDSSYFDNDDVEIYSEFYETFNYEINDDFIAIDNGVNLKIDFSNNQLIDVSNEIFYSIA